MKTKLVYLKMIVAFLLAMGLVSFTSDTLFIANGPQINPNFKDKMLTKVENLGGKHVPVLKDALYFAKSPEERLNKLPFAAIAPGVYAKDDAKTFYTVVKDSETNWISYTFTINGKELHIQVPQGQDPPTQEMLEKMYK